MTERTITAHQLARLLLACPDLPVIYQPCSAEYALTRPPRRVWATWYGPGPEELTQGHAIKIAPDDTEKDAMGNADAFRRRASEAENHSEAASCSRLADIWAERDAVAQWRVED